MHCFLKMIIRMISRSESQILADWIDCTDLRFDQLVICNQYKREYSKKQRPRRSEDLQGKINSSIYPYIINDKLKDH